MRSSRAFSPLATAGLASVPILRKATAATTCLAATWVGCIPDRTKVGGGKRVPRVLRQSAQRDQLDTHRHRGERPSLDLNVAKSIEGFKRVLDMRRGLLQRTYRGASRRRQNQTGDGAIHQHGFAESCGCGDPCHAVHGVNTFEFQPTLDGTCPTRTPTGTIHSGATRGTNRCWGRHFGALEHHEKTAFTVACAQAVSLEGATWTEKEAAKATGWCVFRITSGTAGAAQARGLVSSLHATPWNVQRRRERGARRKGARVPRRARPTRGGVGGHLVVGRHPD